MPRPASAKTNAIVAETSYGTLAKVAGASNPRGMSIARYFTPVSCVACGAVTTTQTSQGPGLCPDCKTQPQTTVLCLNEKIRSYERALEQIKKVGQLFF